MLLKRTIFAGIVLVSSLGACGAGVAERTDTGAEKGSESETASGLWVAGTGGRSVRIDAVPVPLNTEDALVRTVGALTYRGGWALTGESEEFGGWSAMTVTEGELTAFSDQGFWLKAPLRLSADGPFAEEGSVRMGVLDGRLMAEDGKESYDVEGVLRTESGFIISFEQVHRLMQTPEAGAVMTPYPVPERVFRGLSANGGMEAIAAAPDGSLILFVERGRAPDGSLPVWRVKNGEAEALRLALPQNFSPTAARFLPDGDVLLLARAFSVTEGVRVKLLKLDWPDSELGSEVGEGLDGDENRIEGKELATLKPPFSVDNFEALEVISHADGTIDILILSDDNFNSLQRTLLLWFMLGPT